MKTIIYLISTFFLAGCSVSMNVGTPGNGGNSSTPAAKTYPPASTIEQQMDSLAAISYGDYVHLLVGPCLGRCESRVSIFRDSPAKFYVYDGESYIYQEADRDFDLYRLRKPISDDEAARIIRSTQGAGLMRLVADTTSEVHDQPHIWVRARIGDKKLRIDNAYIGGKKYALSSEDKPLVEAYADVRMTLIMKLITP